MIMFLLIELSKGKKYSEFRFFCRIARVRYLISYQSVLINVVNLF